MLFTCALFLTVCLILYGIYFKKTLHCNKVINELLFAKHVCEVVMAQFVAQRAQLLALEELPLFLVNLLGNHFLLPSGAAEVSAAGGF